MFAIKYRWNPPSELSIMAKIKGELILTLKDKQMLNGGMKPGQGFGSLDV